MSWLRPRGQIRPERVWSCQWRWENICGRQQQSEMSIIRVSAIMMVDLMCSGECEETMWLVVVIALPTSMF